MLFCSVVFLLLWSHSFDHYTWNNPSTHGINVGAYLQQSGGPLKLLGVGDLHRIQIVDLPSPEHEVADVEEGGEQAEHLPLLLLPEHQHFHRGLDASKLHRIVTPFDEHIAALTRGGKWF